MINLTYIETLKLHRSKCSGHVARMGEDHSTALRVAQIRQEKGKKQYVDRLLGGWIILFQTYIARG